MFERLHQSAMMMYEQGIVLYKKVDIEMVVNYKDIMMLLTSIVNAVIFIQCFLSEHQYLCIQPSGEPVA